MSDCRGLVEEPARAVQPATSQQRADAFTPTAGLVMVISCATEGPGTVSVPPTAFLADPYSPQKSASPVLPSHIIAQILEALDKPGTFRTSELRPRHRWLLTTLAAVRRVSKAFARPARAQLARYMDVNLEHVHSLPDDAIHRICSFLSAPFLPTAVQIGRAHV